MVFYNKSNISFVTSTGLTSTSKVKNIPLTKEMRDDILGYENIIRIDNSGTHLIGKTSGYITFNINEIETKDFQVHISGITNSGNKTKERLLDKNVEGNFKSNENDLKFSFYAPEFNKYLSTQYQYKLNGVDDNWGAWSENPEVSYENLSFGNYEFNVRARIGNSVSYNSANYVFKIARPWYISSLMIAIYTFGLLLFLFAMHNAYKQYYKKQRQKLIHKNKQELELAQVQNEKEIIRIKNEKLEVEYKSKSKELAASTMSIIKKNELLTAIKRTSSIV